MEGQTKSHFEVGSSLEYTDLYRSQHQPLAEVLLPQEPDVHHLPQAALVHHAGAVPHEVCLVSHWNDHGRHPNHDRQGTRVARSVHFHIPQYSFLSFFISKYGFISLIVEIILG